jgi:hypothetical protein
MYINSTANTAIIAIKMSESDDAAFFSTMQTTPTMPAATNAR